MGASNGGEKTNNNRSPVVTWGICMQFTKGDTKIRDGRLVIKFKEGKFIDWSPYDRELILINGCLVVKTDLDLTDVALLT